LDHIHIFISYNPKYSILDIVRLFKQITTYYLWRNGDNEKILKKFFWKEKTFWSDGYFACSVGDANPETVRKYIREQG
jgi:putative transposase